MSGEQPATFLRQRAEATPDRTALRSTDTGTEYSYRDLDETVTETARALTARTDDGSVRIGLALSSSPEFVVGLYAALRLGWEVVPLNTALTPWELGTQIDRVEPSLCLCERGTEQLTVEAAAGATVLSVDEPTHQGTQSLFAASEPFDPVPPSFDDTVLILFTSGTTGEPKAVRLTAGNLAASAVASAFRLGVDPADRWLCCLPMYHMGGLAPAIRSVFYGTELLLQREFDATATANLIASEGVTGVSLVPTQLRRLLDGGVEPAELRTVLLGGAPASQSLLERASDAGLPVYPTYGLTETASQVTTARPAETEAYPGTVGQPLLGTTVRIVADGTPLDPGERGEIVVDGPTVTPGYLDGERSRAAFSEWGLHTGDVGYTDEDGRLWVLGRRDETIITGGELVAPAAVAEELRSVTGVADAAVAGVDDPEWGERVGAVLVAATDASSPTEVRQRAVEHCRERLAGYKRPKTVAVVEELPRTQSGTVDRDALRQLLRTAGSTVTDRDFS